MGPCVAYKELEEALEDNIISGRLSGTEDQTARLEWLLVRHNTDGEYGCDWCILAEEIRRLRAGLQEISESLEKDLRQRSV